MRAASRPATRSAPAAATIHVLRFRARARRRRSGPSSTAGPGGSGTRCVCSSTRGGRRSGRGIGAGGERLARADRRSPPAASRSPRAARAWSGAGQGAGASPAAPRPAARTGIPRRGRTMLPELARADRGRHRGRRQPGRHLERPRARERLVQHQSDAVDVDGSGVGPLAAEDLRRQIGQVPRWPPAVSVPSPAPWRSRSPPA